MLLRTLSLHPDDAGFLPAALNSGENMLQRTECELVLVEHFDWARHAMAKQCRRFRMSVAETEDFESWAVFRLVENDYRILRQFRGDSSVRTYLSVVIRTLHREFVASRWGRYRPSAAARRAGTTALELERLMGRDRLSARHAALTIHTRRSGALSERDLMRLALSLPVRCAEAKRTVELTIDAAAPDRADDRIRSSEDLRERAMVLSALAYLLDELSDLEIRVVRLRFWEGLSVADISRELGIEQKPLYRTLTRLLESLRRRLESHGITRVSALATMCDDAA